MAKLAIHRDFLARYVQLDKQVRARVDDTFRQFDNATHTGLHLEKVQHARDPRMRTIRITGFWRGVVLAPETGETYLLLRVLPHDDANDWARRHSADVNAASGAIEIWDPARVEQLTPDLEAVAQATQARLFDAIGDGDLRRLGIGEQLLPLVRLLSDEAHLDALRTLLPEQQYDVLAGLASGMSPEEVWADVAAPEPVTDIDPGDLDTAMSRAQGRVALVSGPDELMEILHHPFALWRVFLHPSQQRVVHRTYNGPARVSGGAGTGKTVVALHRAGHLARRPDVPDGSILLTTFTRTLADDLRANLSLLLGEEQLRKVEVCHVDKVANQVVAGSLGRAPVPLSSAEERSRWKAVVERLDLPLSVGFLAGEWQHVVQAQNLRTREAYLAASRTGRGVGLTAVEREQAWQAVQEFAGDLRHEERWTFTGVCVAAADLLNDRDTRPYRHVIVDEAQDLHPAQWRLLRAAVAEGPDDLFIAGDTHQRIYDNRVSLRSLGVRVTGRSSRLRINYRTTAEILRWSLGLLTGERVDDMDGGQESRLGYRSAMHGGSPTVTRAGTWYHELDLLASRIREWLADGVEPDAIGVAARTNRRVEEVVAGLGERGVAAAKTGARQRNVVRVGTMHRMKGLEFRCVAVVGLGEDTVPMPAAVADKAEDPARHAQDVQRERCLLYVACTRAREALYVSWHGAPSPFLPCTS